jgi:hypothetical protein
MVNVLDPFHTAGRLDAGYQQKGLQPLAKSLVGAGLQGLDRPSLFL